MIGMRPLEADGSVSVDTLMLAAAVQQSARTRYRFVVRRPDLVVLEFLEREPSETAARWQVRCPGCGASDVSEARAPIACMACASRATPTQSLAIQTRVPAGWAWVGDTAWSIARARELGKLDVDPRNVWGRYPIGCLFACAIREGLRQFSPDALPLGVKIAHGGEPDEPTVSVEQTEAVVRAAAAPVEPERAPWEEATRYGPTIHAGRRPYGTEPEKPVQVPTPGDARMAALARTPIEPTPAEAENALRLRDELRRAFEAGHEDTGQKAEASATPGALGGHVHADPTSGPVPTPAPTGAQEGAPLVPPDAPVGPAFDRDVKPPNVMAEAAERVAENRAARVQAMWSTAVAVLAADEDVDVPCALCGLGFDAGDRYRDSTTGVEFAHAVCVADVAAGRDPLAGVCADCGITLGPDEPSERREHGGARCGSCADLSSMEDEDYGDAEESLSGGDLEDKLDAALRSSCERTSTTASHGVRRCSLVSGHAGMCSFPLYALAPSGLVDFETGKPVDVDAMVADAKAAHAAQGLGPDDPLPPPFPQVTHREVKPENVLADATVVPGTQASVGLAAAAAFVPTAEQTDDMLHALGLKDVPPKDRNHYCAEDGRPSLEELVRAGLMERGGTINEGRDRYYRVTPAGRAFVCDPRVEVEPGKWELKKPARHRWAASTARHTHCERCGLLKGYPPSADLASKAHLSWSADAGKTWTKGTHLPPCGERVKVGAA